MKQTICFTGKRLKDLWGYDITQYRDLNRELKYSLRHLCYHYNLRLSGSGLAIIQRWHLSPRAS